MICKKTAVLKSQLDAFEHAPRALDGYLQQYISSICSLYFAAKDKTILSPKWEAAADTFADLIYVLAKIKGHKTVANELSNDVYLVPRLVKLVEMPKVSKRHSECYFLLLWLSRLVLVPFPLSTVEGGLDSRILAISLNHLAEHSTASKTQVISLNSLALLVTRPDCGKLFSQYTESVLIDWPVLDENAKLGHLMALNQILKKQKTGQIFTLAPEIHQQVLLYEIARVKYADANYKLNTLNALYLLKVAAKISKFFISQAQYEPVASLINSTTDLMHYMGDLFDASLRECMAKNLAKTVAYLATKAVNYADQVISYMMSQFRVCKLDTNTGFVSDLSIEPAHLSVPRYHTILLFLGFMALTKSLPEEIVPLVFAIAHQTCFVSQRTFSFVQSTQLRDASCFCLWAIFRMLSKQLFMELRKKFPLLVPIIFFDLIKISIFDEDFTMRRCGIAVLQEFIGRFGSDFLGEMIKTSDTSKVGAFTIRFIEHFGASTVGSLGDSHEIIHFLMEMGFSPDLFVTPLLDEILADLSPFELQKLGSCHLSRVLLNGNSKSLDIPISSGFTVNEVVDSLISSLKLGIHSAIYVLAELETHNLILPEKLVEISAFVENIRLKNHFSVASLGESIMHWFNASFVSNSGQNLDRVFPMVSNLQRLDATESLVLEFKIFFQNFQALPLDQFSQMCRHIRSGNKLLAASIMLTELDVQRILELCSLFRDKSLDAEVRAILILSIKSTTFKSDGAKLIAPTIVELLDDYTLSDQGDVGLKVRQACVALIKQNLPLFSNQKLAVEAKVLRIAGETIDRLRILAFRVLCRLSGSTAKSDYDNKEEKNYNDYDSYFADLFDYYTQKCVGSEEMEDAFWSGIIHSAGASTGANTMINLSFRQVLQHLRNTENVELTFRALLRLLRVPPGVKVSNLSRRAQKTLQATMNLLVKIFDAAVDIPESVSFESLFVRTYNLHINTTMITRIGLAIQIFQHIATIQNSPDMLKVKCRKRICWLGCNHAIGKVRALAADALFEIANEADPHHEILLLIDSAAWDIGKPTATTVSKLESVFQTI